MGHTSSQQRSPAVNRSFAALTEVPSEPIPLSVLTGFLGSGKTTLLSRMLAVPDLRDTAVLISEFGAVALDHHLLEATVDDVVELPNGCTCCAVRQGLADSLSAAAIAPGRRPAAVPAHRARDQRPVRSRADALHAFCRRFSGSLAAPGPRRDGDRCRGRCGDTRSLSRGRRAGRRGRSLLLTKTDLAPRPGRPRPTAGDVQSAGADRRARDADTSTLLFGGSPKALPRPRPTRRRCMPTASRPSRSGCAGR